MGVFEDVLAGLGYAPRPQQTELVRVARETMRGGQRFVQAGTGTGKSYAVLSVALEHARQTGMPSVVICPNNTLIDQYVTKDAPAVNGIAGGKFVHIKGRNRYVCADSAALIFKKRDGVQALFLGWAAQGGGFLEWAKLGLDESYACPGSDVCDGELCGAIMARMAAVDADVIITNAHVLMWDYLIGIYTAGAAGLLPEYGALFVDECHELESVGRGCLSDEITSKSPVADEVPRLKEWMAEVGRNMVKEGRREQALEQSLAIQQMAAEATRMAVDLEYSYGDEIPKTVKRQIKRLRKFADIATNDSPFHVSIVEAFDSPGEGGARALDKVQLRRVCVDASSQFAEILTAQPTVLVSGTIPGSDRRRLGLPKVRIADVGHPFDYSKSTLVVSRYSPKESTDIVHRVNSAVRAINQTKGGTLLLFTSWADLETVTPLIAERLDAGIDVYAQSKDEPATLPEDVEAFRQDGNAVLAGVRSLFTGLDIPGPALRQVILWKLPYAVPTIEVKAIQDRFGRAVYRDQMTMTLVQAVGRLIRTTDDEGRILIMDCRAAKLRWADDRMAYHLDEFRRQR